MRTAPRAVPLSWELTRMALLLILAALAITVILPDLLALAAAAAR